MKAKQAAALDSPGEMKVTLTVTSEWPGRGVATDTIEMDQDQWARLTQDERDELCESTAAEVFGEYCSYGFEVEVTEQ